VNILLGKVAKVNAFGQLSVSHLHVPVFHHFGVDQAPYELKSCKYQCIVMTTAIDSHTHCLNCQKLPGITFAISECCVVVHSGCLSVCNALTFAFTQKVHFLCERTSWRIQVKCAGTLKRIQVKFVYQCHRVKVKVTGGKCVRVLQAFAIYNRHGRPQDFFPG